MGARALDAAAPEPVVPPGRPPAIRRNAPEWIRDNLLWPWHNAVLTVVFGAVVAFALFRLARFVVVTGRWEIVEVNLTNFMVGRYPRGELYRVWIAVAVTAVAIGLGGGLTAARRPALSLRAALTRIAPLLALIAVLLWFARTPLVLLLAAGTALLCAAGWAAGRRLPQRAANWLPLLYLAALGAVQLAYAAFGGVGWDQYGGLLLTLFLSVGGILVSFPVGVLLALGRRSTFWVVRLFCVAYIELIRGVPLITLLFMGALMLGFLLPAGMERPADVTRALVAIVLFSAAYVAEIVRGGLQGVPRAQEEAALALGLSPVRATLLVVLPQALRNVIPALVGTFISLFKDTSLVVIIGLTELLRVAQTVTRQPDFAGQGLAAETLAFAGFVYWVLGYTMSRSSQRLEHRLGVGQT